MTVLPVIYTPFWGVCWEFSECFHISEPWKLVYGGILVISFTVFWDYAWWGNMFDIYLDSLSGIKHLFIRLWYLLWVWESYRFPIKFSQDTPKTCDRAGIASLPQFDPEDDKADAFVSPVHIFYQGDLLIGVLVRMMVRFSWAICKGIDGTVISF